MLPLIFSVYCWITSHQKKLMLTASVLFVARGKLGRGSEKRDIGRNWD
jgi:hypothetical protein